MSRENNSVYMLSFSVSGIKNIENWIRFDFYKRTIDKDFDPSDFRVKAIYGENGSGKTAVITAVRLFKELVTNPRYLDDSGNQQFLNHIVNKNKNRVELETEILIKKDGIDVIRYHIELQKNADGFFELVSESLERKSGNYANNKYRVIYNVEAGEIKKIVCGRSLKRKIIKASMNRLLTRTLVTYYINVIGDVLDFLFYTREKPEISENQIKDASLVWLLIAVTFSFYQTSIYLDEEDTHNLYFVRKTFENIRQHIDDKKIEDFFGDRLLDFISVDSENVPKDQFPQYEKKIKKMENFIRIFKTNLISIGVDRKEDGEYYKCRLIMNYPSYSIDSEFESTGIRKLIRLYDCLVTASNGGIVFIDELDSNINDIYLCKLIEYMMYYGKGQLCFTTHNVDPMEFLKDYKNSIDFLSSSNTVSSWTAHGNASPANAYRNGQIEDIPFNIDAIDFVGLFEEEQE